MMPCHETFHYKDEHYRGCMKVYENMKVYETGRKGKVPTNRKITEIKDVTGTPGFHSIVVTQ